MNAAPLRRGRATRAPIRPLLQLVPLVPRILAYGQNRLARPPGRTLNWFALAFLSGAVNVGGFLACERFVTHVTGFATLFGADLAAGKWAEGLSMLAVPLFFLAGTMTSGWLIERRLCAGQAPRCSVAMLLVATSLLAAALGGNAGWFGVFGAPLEPRDDLPFLVLLCLASGLQNAIATSVSGATVRTTHLTGITTDLGIGLVRLLCPAPDERDQDRERRLNRLRAGSILSFVLGAALGALVFGRFGYLGFLLPAAIAAYGAWVVRPWTLAAPLHPIRETC